MGNCLAAGSGKQAIRDKDQRKRALIGDAWLDGIYGALKQSSPTKALASQFRLYDSLSNADALSKYEIARQTRQASASVAQRLNTTDRSKMVTVSVPPKPDHFAMNMKDAQLLQQIQLIAQAGIGAFAAVGLQVPVSVICACCPWNNAPITHDQLVNKYRGVPCKIIIQNKMDMPKDKDFGLRAAADLERVLDPSFVQTNSQFVVVGTCYNGCQGVLRVLEWVDSAAAGFCTLHCRYILHEVPLWLMTAYTGSDVSLSILMRHSPDRQLRELPALDVRTNDEDTWEVVRKSRVQLRYQPEPREGSAPVAEAWSFPHSKWAWLTSLFGNEGSLDYGADRIGSPTSDASGQYLCASVPVMLALAITKVEDFREMTMNLFSYQVDGSQVEVYSTSGGRNITACGHVAPNSDSNLVGRQWVAVVLAFNHRTPENDKLYLWD